MVKTKKKWGFLAPTRKEAERMEAKYKVHFTPLIDYMEVIFPDIDDWEEEKEIDVGDVHLKPDLFSHKRKKIIQLITKNRKLDFNKRNVIKCGYDVYVFSEVRQLTNTTVKQLFGVDVSEALFDENTPTLSQPWLNYNIEPLFKNNWYNIKKVYYGDTKQYNVNINALVNKDNSVALNRVIIKSLFDLYSYEINLNADSNISILIGPNGCGKTTILNMIQLMLSGYGDIKEIIKIPFKSIICVLSNGKKVQMEHSEDNQGLFLFINSKKIMSFNKDDITSVSNKKCGLKDLLRENNCYIDIFFQTTLRLFSKAGKKDEDGDKKVHKYYDTIPETQSHFKDFCGNLVGYYEIEKLDREQDLFNQYINPNNREKLLSNEEFEVEWYKFSEKMNEYVQNQALNSPLRRNMDEISENIKIVELYKKGYKREFLCTYLRLFKETLPEFEKAHKKTLKFQEIINDRFKITKKQLQYRYREMYLTVGDGKNRKEIPFDVLSSGEKNDFIMFYNLIFKCHNGMVLVDEPEISLHIEWQERYIDDLLKICKMNNIQALVATHSPNIINDHTDLIAKWEIKDEL